MKDTVNVSSWKHILSYRASRVHTCRQVTGYVCIKYTIGVLPHGTHNYVHVQYCIATIIVPLLHTSFIRLPHRSIKDHAYLGQFNFEQKEMSAPLN